MKLVNATLEEERMRQVRKLNVQNTGLSEKEAKTLEEDRKKLCKIMGYAEEEPPLYERI